MFKTLQEAQEEEKIADIFGLEKEDGKWRFIIRNGAGKKLHYIDFSEEVSEFKSFLSLVWDSAYRAGRKEIEEVLKENEGNFLSSHRIQHILAGRSCGLEKLETLRK